MFNRKKIKELEDMVERLRSDLGSATYRMGSDIEHRLRRLESPPKFKVGDSVKFHGETFDVVEVGWSSDCYGRGGYQYSLYSCKTKKTQNCTEDNITL